MTAPSAIDDSSDRLDRALVGPGTIPRPVGARAGLTPDRISLLILVVSVILSPIVFTSTSMNTVFVTAGFFALVVLSLQWMIGYVGMLALGHPALMGVGAYVSAILTTSRDWPFLAAAAVAVAVVVGVALVISPLLRLDGVYFALATLVLIYLFIEGVKFWPQYTGGASGLTGIERMPLASNEGPMRHFSYYVVWTLVIVTVFISRRLVKTRAGRSLFALREDADVARSIGIRAASTRMQIWLASAAVTGLAGVLYAHQIRYLSPEQFGFAPALTVVAMLMIGGAFSPIGAVIGVLFFQLAPEVFSPFAEYRVFLLGISLLLVVGFAPGGLVTIPARIRQLTHSSAR